MQFRCQYQYITSTLLYVPTYPHSGPDKLTLLTCSVAYNTNIFTMDTVMVGSVLTVHKPGLIPNTGYIIQKD